VGIAVAISSVQTKKYSATAQLLMQPAGSGFSLIPGNQQTISPTDILTELQLLKSAPVKAKGASELGFEPSISASQVGQTNVISVTATARTPSLAAKTANIYAKAFVASERTSAINVLISGEEQYQKQINAINLQIQGLATSHSSATSSTISALAGQEAVLKGDEAQLEVDAAETPGGVEVVSLAIRPSSPSSPRPLLDGILALVIGLLLGLGAAFLVEYLDDKVYTKEEAERLTSGVPVLVMIPRIRRWKKRGPAKLIAQEEPFSPITESYRSLRASLLFAGRDTPLKTILATSATGAEGKTSTVANLGVVLANAGKLVVLVDCDLRQPRLGEFLGLSEAPGFTSVLLGEDDLISAVKPVANIPGLAFLGAGPIRPNAAELLGSSSAANIFRRLAGDFDVVLLDGPSLPVADALVLTSYADAILLVVAVGETKKRHLMRATELLNTVVAHPIGIVLNKGRQSKNDGNYTYRNSTIGGNAVTSPDESSSNRTSAE
jgi:capsular exopolysaccharide synthesis family protein